VYVRTLEVLASEVEVHAAAQPVPPADAALHPVDVNLTNQQVAAEDVVDDQVVMSQCPQAGFPACQSG
jgi:hypothetical protein